MTTTLSIAGERVTNRSRAGTPNMLEVDCKRLHLVPCLNMRTFCEWRLNQPCGSTAPNGLTWCMKWRENHSHDKVLCACDDGYETPADKLDDVMRRNVRE
jgi:hypothetical protein